MYVVYFVSSLLLGYFDRLRGSGRFKYSHFAGQVGMGLSMAILLGHYDWRFIYVALAVGAGSAKGWGEPLGSAFDNRPMGPTYETWQVGILRKNTFLALLVRGLMWGAPVTIVSIPAAISLTLSFLIAPYWARALPTHLDRWAIMELGRGLISGLLTSAILLATTF